MVNGKGGLIEMDYFSVFFSCKCLTNGRLQGNAHPRLSVEREFPEGDSKKQLERRRDDQRALGNFLVSTFGLDLLQLMDLESDLALSFLQFVPFCLGHFSGSFILVAHAAFRIVVFGFFDGS